MKLSDMQCRNAKPRKKAYKLADGGGLHLLVRPTGTKVFQYRFELPASSDGSKRKEGTYTVGDYGRPPRGETADQTESRLRGRRVSLAEARAIRDRMRDLVKQGINPNQQRRLEQLARARQLETTLALVAAEWVDRKEWEPETKRRRLDTLTRVVFPTLGTVPVADVRSSHVLEILLQAESQNGPAVAAEVRRSLHGIFDWAVATLRAAENPVERVRGALKTPKSRHKRPLPVAELGEFMRDLTAYQRNFQTVAAFRLMWWTLCRPGEVCGARWDEVDVDKLVWTVSADRMKKREHHRVPLPTQSVPLLGALKMITGGSEHLFPHRDRSGEHMKIETLRQATYSMGWTGRYTPYATRATGSTILNELGFASDWIERQLDHRERNRVRASYNRAEYLPQRRSMMQRWADILVELEQGSTEIDGWTS